MNPNKADQLQQIAEEIEGLSQSPLYDYRIQNGYQAVPGEGNPDAAIIFIGEAPGGKEAKTGRPFVGAAGKTLDRLLQGIDLARQDVYITNIVKDRPPKNRDPRPEEIELYAPFLVRQIEIIRPQVIATLGRFAMDFMLQQFDLPQQGQKIGALHGQILPVRAAYGPISLVPLYHPAAALYNNALWDTLIEDFERLKQLTNP